MPSRKVAIFGHGTIGGGVSRILLAEQQKIAAKSGITLELAAICTKDAELDPEIYTTYRSLFRDASEVLADPEIDIICETIGGDGIALQFVKTALQNGKHVVTANKKMIALHFAELSALAREHNATLRYEAAVGGGIPLLSTVSDGLVADDITFVEGILNGTTNFILSKMASEGAEFAEVLKEAQDLGYAEADPTDDVEGFDVAYKLAILCALTFGCQVHPDAIPRTGVTKVTAADFTYARHFGGSIKLLASAELTETGDLIAQVAPTLILGQHRIATVDGVLNAVNFVGKYNTVGNFLSGEGAGRFATAAAIVSDMAAIATGSGRDTRPTQSINAVQTPTQAYFLRFRVHDRPGILGQICSVFGEHDINIDAVEQLGHQHGDAIHFALTTFPVESARFQQALQQVSALDFNAEAPFVLPMRG